MFIPNSLGILFSSNFCICLDVSIPVIHEVIIAFSLTFSGYIILYSVSLYSLTFSITSSIYKSLFNKLPMYNAICVETLLIIAIG